MYNVWHIDVGGGGCLLKCQLNVSSSDFGQFHELGKFSLNQPLGSWACKLQCPYVYLCAFFLRHGKIRKLQSNTNWKTKKPFSLGGMAFVFEGGQELKTLKHYLMENFGQQHIPKI